MREGGRGREGVREQASERATDQLFTVVTDNKDTYLYQIDPNCIIMYNSMHPICYVHAYGLLGQSILVLYRSSLVRAMYAGPLLTK